VANLKNDRQTILIVDDMQTNIALLSELLIKTYDVKVAKNGAKAIEITKNGGIDLILLDIIMPEMDGFEVCRILKSDKNTHDIPIIFVTANQESAEEEMGFLLGAVDYITKPYKPTTVLSRVKTHLLLKIKNKILHEQNRELKKYISLVDKNVITSTTNLHGNIIYVSEAFCNISGYSKEELLGENHRIVRHPDMPESLYVELWNTITNNKSWEGEIKNIKKDGNFYWVYAVISPIYDVAGEKTGYTAIRQDITDKKIIEEISITDGMTNIYNRRHFNDTFPKIINRAKRDDEIVCFLLMDIDHFKQYNDNYGHQKGDDVLIKFATCLKESLHRADDLPFRLGGEEFGIVFTCETKERAIEFANSIKMKIENLSLEHKYNSASRFITASMGLVCKHGKEIKDMDSIYKEADDLLYHAKESGRNKVCSN
jgi:diguanylate cyclase (GGDEF)-like protein/PAS domain S-box-containing protein